MNQTLVDMGAAYPLLINHWPGSTDRLVVVFSGVGSDPAEYPQIEFFRTATQGEQNHALFIRDMSRSWLNAPGLDTQIIEMVEKVAADHAISEIAMIGNSMGGSMALLLAHQIKAKCVLAFVPQYSVCPDVVPEETRWKRYRKHITHFRFHEAVPEVSPDQKIFVVHGGTEAELAHALRFPKTPAVRHFIIPKYGHSLAAKLHNKKALGPLINAALADRPVKFRRLIERQGGVPLRRFQS